MAEILDMFEPPVKCSVSLGKLYANKAYSEMRITELLMIHRALCHKMLITDPDLLGPEYDVRLNEVSDEMLRRVTSAGVELVP